MNPSSIGASVLRCCLWLVLMVNALTAGAEEHADQDDHPVPTVLAKRGELVVDDDGSRDRGGKVIGRFENGVKSRAGAGIWKRADPTSNVWRSTWSPGIRHPPVVSYQGFQASNLVVEVAFRFGEMTEPWQTQSFRIAVDDRPKVTGHIVSA